MNSVKNRIMAHLIAGYPDMEKSLEIALLLAESGVSALEIQFPFSDPTADGPAIEKASMISLENGFRVTRVSSLCERQQKRQRFPCLS
jgi:tryptophan synthase alpha chain